jgi:ligand-binding SRPBCC domain-containing protein
MASFVIERTVNIPIERVWSIIADFSKAPTPDISVVVEKKVDPKAAGVGTIRRVTIGKVCVQEILDSANPPNAFTYRILSRAPMKEYRGTVTFTDMGGKTLIRWSADLKPKIPLTGAICCRVAKGVVNQVIDSIEKHHTL